MAQDQEFKTTLHEAFDASMALVGPFEHQPHLAVAVSGGADSMALALLTQGWVDARSGRITCLVVDHGLRDTATTEAEQTKERLARCGISATILTWVDDKPEHGIQAVARDARYRLMEDWCRDHGILHLLVGHHAGDQAETVLMRLERGSGPDGLAGMSMIVERQACRIVRPLLGVDKQDLMDFLQARGMVWVEDPSNRNPQFARTKVREELDQNPARRAGLLASARRFAQLRDYMEDASAKWLAQHVRLDPSGYALVDKIAFIDAEPDIRQRALQSLAHGIGGPMYRPSAADIEPLTEALLRDKGAAVARAVFSPRGQRIMVYRENRNLPHPVRVSGSSQTQSVLWDRRFRIEIAPQRDDLTIMPWAHVSGGHVDRSLCLDRAPRIPHSALAVLPTVRLGQKNWLPSPGRDAQHGVAVRFFPSAPIGGTGFFVA